MKKTNFDFAAFLGISDNALPINNNVFQKISAIRNNLQEGVITYNQLNINKAFFKDFLKAITKGCKEIVSELKEVSKSTKTPLENNVGIIDYNLLDFLEGTIKSAVDCQVVSWKLIGLENENLFNELILKIKEVLVAFDKENLICLLDENYFQKINGRSNPCCKLNDFDVTGDIDEETGDDLNEEDEMSTIKKRSNCCFEIIKIDVPIMEDYLPVAENKNDFFENQIAIKESCCHQHEVKSFTSYPRDVFTKQD